MIRTHILTWICGKPVWLWKWITFTEWGRLTHYTGAMIKLKAAKIAVGSAIIGCTAIVPPVVYYGPGIARDVLYGPGDYQRIAGRPGVPTNVPEPAPLGILALGIGAVWWVRRR